MSEQAKKLTPKEILQPALSLFLFCLIVTALLAGTNLLTKDKIAEQERLAEGNFPYDSQPRRGIVCRI